jgi:hypothetical protein
LKQADGEACSCISSLVSADLGQHHTLAERKVSSPQPLRQRSDRGFA